MQARRRILRANVFQISVIAVIHRENVVEPVKIFGKRLPGAKRGQVYSADSGGLDHARIWWLAGMPSPGSSAVDLPVEPVARRNMPRDAISGGGPANIAETYKEQAHGADPRLGRHCFWLEHAAFDQLFANLNRIERGAFA